MGLLHLGESFVVSMREMHHVIHREACCQAAESEINRRVKDQPSPCQEATNRCIRILVHMNEFWSTSLPFAALRPFLPRVHTLTSSQASADESHVRNAARCFFSNTDSRPPRLWLSGQRPRKMIQVWCLGTGLI